MTLFLIIGGIGLALLIITTIVDGIFEFDFALGDGLLSGPVIAAFLTAFGAGGAIAVGSGASTFVGVGVGLAAGATIGGITGVATKSLMRMPTDATPRAADLNGCTGTVVSTIPEDGYGEVSVMLGGQPVKLSARTTGPHTLTVGTAVVVSSVLSPTSVTVTTK